KMSGHPGRGRRSRAYQRSGCPAVSSRSYSIKKSPFSPQNIVIPSQVAPSRPIPARLLDLNRKKKYNKTGNDNNYFVSKEELFRCLLNRNIRAKKQLRNRPFRS